MASMTISAPVLRFRSSHHFAAPSHASFGSPRSTRNFLIPVRFMKLRFLGRTRRDTGRSFKFTAPGRHGVLLAALIGVALAGVPGTLSHGWLNWTAPTRAQPVPGGPGAIADIVDKVKPAVVGVRSSVALAAEDQQRLDQTWERLFGEPKDSAKGKADSQARARAGGNLGSGFFISPDGYIVTTNHIVEGSQTIEITTDEAKTYTARMIGSDPRTDLALLKVDDERGLSVGVNCNEDAANWRVGRRSRQSVRIGRHGHGRHRVGASA
jgi:hypothetical protein